jgi:hypothetical protein
MDLLLKLRLADESIEHCCHDILLRKMEIPIRKPAQCHLVLHGFHIS